MFMFISLMIWNWVKLGCSSNLLIMNEVIKAKSSEDKVSEDTERGFSAERNSVGLVP